MDSDLAKIKNRERVAAWRKENPEKVKEYRARYVEKNPEKVKAYQKKYDQEKRDKERVRERVIIWKEKNPDKVKEWAKKYYQSEKGVAAKERARIKRAEYAASPEGIAKKMAWERQLAEWAATKKERVRIARKRQREAKKARDIASGKIVQRKRMTPEEKKEAKATARRNRKARERAAVGKLSKGIRKLLYEAQQGKCPVCKSKLILDGAKKCHIDHVVPLSAGGTNTDDNVQLLCFECNVSKGAKNSVEFMQSRGFLL